jgi:CheY-like chemotaxis protein/HPt (histidine-containing phosphotransfer) domain-containing protein
MLAVKAEEKSLELACAIDPQVPAFVRGDPGRIRQILVNLCGNAIKFTGTGEIVVRVSVAGKSEDSISLKFEVRDTGIGIPSNRLPELFSPFTQMDGSTTRRYGGTGLGLSISKQLAELMGGQIGAESREGKGSTFWFTVALQERSVRANQTTSVELTGTKVLIVDDHRTNRLLLSTLLASWGCRPAEAEDGRTGELMLREALAAGKPYRIALIDMLMPDMDGEALGSLIKDDPFLSQTALVMITSLGQRGDAKRLEDLGFAGYLVKPVREGKLREMMRCILNGTAETAPAEKAILTGHSFPARRGRILVAEDNATNQLVAVKLLEKLGCRADVVANGQESLAALSAIHYDLVLMDCQMPEMDGFEATKRIRRGEAGAERSGVPIVAMTARAMQGDREACIEAGMNDYVSKPVDITTLEGALDRWLTPLTRKTEDAGSTRRTPSEAPIFDKAAVSDRLMGDEELIVEVLSLFLEDTPGRIETLKAKVADGDAAAAGEQAHAIKGAAAGVGGEVFRTIAFELEKAGKAGDLKKLRRMAPVLGRCFADLALVMEAEIKDRKGPT